MLSVAAVQAIIDRACEQHPDFADAWYAECERQLVGLRTLPTTGKKRTWGKMGALQQQAEPDVAQAAMGGTPSPYPRNAGSTGAIILSGLTAQTPCLAAGTRDKSDGCPVAGLMGGVR